MPKQLISNDCVWFVPNCTEPTFLITFYEGLLSFVASIYLSKHDFFHVPKICWTFCTATSPGKDKIPPFDWPCAAGFFVHKWVSSSVLIIQFHNGQLKTARDFYIPLVLESYFLLPQLIFTYMKIKWNYCCDIISVLLSTLELTNLSQKENNLNSPCWGGAYCRRPDYVCIQQILSQVGPTPPSSMGLL